MIARRLILALFCLIAATSTHAVTLDWDQNAWATPSPTAAPNVTSSSFDIDPAKAGNDIKITATATADAVWQPSLPAAPTSRPMTPVVSQAFQGGDPNTIHNSLELSVDFGAKQNRNSPDIYITVTIDFSAQYVNGVSNVSFTLFDIDYANVANNTYQDEITNIVATTTSGGTMAPTITGLGSAVAQNGTALAPVLDGIASVADTGAGSGDGNATISFNGDNIRSITFTYLANQTFTDPTYQHIGISNITFSPVPEINPAWSAVVSCALAGGLILRHGARFRK